MASKFSKHKLPVEEQYPIVDDMKLRLTLAAQADKWNEFARNMIYATYNDTELLLLYKRWRDSGVFDHGSKDKVRREVIKFPNGYVYNYCKAVFEPIYGKDWPINKKVWQHELIKPWLLISKP